MTLRMGVREWAVLALTALMFGSGFYFTKLAIQWVPPITLSAARASLAAPLAWLLLRLLGGYLPPLGRAWLPLMGLGVLAAAIPFAAVAYGQTRIESGLGGILFGSIPVLTVVLAHFLTADERFTATRFLGAMVGLAGVVLVIGPKALAGLGGHLLGEAATLFAAFSYAIGGILARRLHGVPPAGIATGQVVCAAIVMVPLSLAADAPWRLALPFEAYAVLVVIAVVNTALPMTATLWLIRRAGATNTSLMAFLVPVVAVVLGAILLGETLPWAAFGGLALILLGAATVSRRPRGTASAAG